MPFILRQLQTSDLLVAYLEDGASDGWPIVLTHGFPYDVHAFDDVVPLLIDRGARVIRPFVRGYGSTSFLSPSTMRSGQQAALGRDLIEILEAIGIEGAIVAGFDWGGLASCVAAALWPDKIGGLVSYAGYDIVDIKRQQNGFPLSLEKSIWYQHLFQTDRGRVALTESRKELAGMLWREWSPNWDFDETTLSMTAASFENPDFVDVVLHCYRFHFGLADSDPRLLPLEAVLASRPAITVPCVTLDGTDDPLKPGGTAHHAKMFVGRHEHRVIKAGHNIPKEDPSAFADAILTVRQWLAEGRIRLPYAAISRSS
ncbi:alpha/beta fold hydrolase [Granulicella tundricola]|uniref:Alpha/beta hydrolase fold protein n=1 Tax=Granulicella tundricola (strain ATCC BAA-1859 / DSM 23138 / MP5ACTX9) TaxID=1198114 RepID=E8X503_GRATM|nr:alpha/beta hydrolase [Granulicella tundricola]ADW67195.1 alpha/beta hydrolase fold protein [Granulicella tundricola MP5ACTX9]